MIHEEETYRPAFFPLFTGIFAGAFLCCTLVTLGLEAAAYQLPGVVSFSFLRILAIVYLWSMLCAGVVVWMLSIKVTAEGLRGRTFWGTATAVSWQDTRAATRTGIPGLRFLRVYSFDERSPMWVPLFLRKRDEFRRRVTAAVSETHPLRAALGK